MATSLLALLDDIASILDDVSVMTKVAAKKTAGVLGDDLALNAEQVSGVRADRELYVVWAVAKGSVRNKLILVPAALAISAFLPWAVTPLLMVGGLFLCYEGFEKVAHTLLQRREDDEAHHAAHRAALVQSREELLAVAKDKIQGAIQKYGKLATIKLFIAGHTDTVSDAAYNRTLSNDRARAIGRWFKQRGVGIPIRFAGFGEDVLLVQTPDETDEPRNRRAEYIVAVDPPPVSGQVAFRPLD